MAKAAAAPRRARALQRPEDGLPEDERDKVIELLQGIRAYSKQWLQHVVCLTRRL